MADLTLTVFDVDDVTALFEVGTASDHANPYLEEPEDLVASEIDLLNGGGYIGGLTVRVIDPQTGSTQAERWLTSRLGVPAGQLGEGHSQLKGHRALLQTGAGRTLMDGTITHVRLNESYAGFTLNLKDIRERPRKVEVFTSAARRDAGGAIVAAPTVLPRGRMEGYGQLPMYRVLPTSLQNAYGWTIPPAVPLTARVDDDAGLPILNLIPTEWPADWNESKNFPPGLVATDAIRDVCSRLESEQEGSSYFNTFPDVRVLWRNNNTEAWREVEVAAWGIWSVIESSLRTVTYRGLDENGDAATIREDLPVISTVHLGSSGTMPTVGATVEFLLVYVGEPEAAYPYTFEGTAGEFLADLYDGQMSEHDPRTRYDAAAVAAITTPIRVRQREKRDSLRDVEEEVYRAIGYAPAVIDGLVTPVAAEYPPPGATLPEITDDSAMPVPGWEDDTSSAVTEVVLTYHRDFRVGASNDPLGRRSDGDGVGSREVTHRVPAPDWAIDLVGDNPHEIDGWIFRALGGVEGSAIAGDVMDETGARIAVSRGHRVLDRWLLGGQISAVRLRAADFPTIRVGDWVIDSRSWRPNYNTLQRGGPVLAQVMSLQPDGGAWLDLVLVDAGPSAQPLAAPTVGVLSADSDGAVTVPITGVPTGASAEVRYAINDTEPAAGSSLWTPGGRREGDGNIVLPQAPAGATVWVEARSVAIGRRPSDWTAAASVAITSTPRVTDVSATARDDGSVLFEWDPNVAAAGVRIHYEAHEPGATPTLPNSVDVDGSAGSHTLPAGTVDPTQALTADVEPWTGWDGTAVSGTAGKSVRVTASRGAVVGALTASVVFNAANEAVVQANAPAGTSNIYITVGVDADPADPSSSSNDASIVGDGGRVNTGVVVAEGSVAHVKVRADSGPVVLVLAKNTEGGAISATLSFDASHNVHVAVADSPVGTTNLYITVGAGTAPADPTSTTYDATIAGDSGSVNTGVIVSAGEVAHVKVGAHDGASMTDIASFTRGNDQATGNQIILGTPRWSPLSGGAILEQPIDFGTDTRSVRVQYQYASTPGGALDTTVDYTFDTGTGGGIVTHSVEDELGAIKEWDAAEAAPSITYTPYDGITGGGNAGNSKTITPDAPGDTGSVGGRVDNKTAALTRPAQGSIIEFDDDSGLEAYVTAGGGAGVRVKASKVWAINQGGTGSSTSPAEAGYIWRSTGVDAMGLYDLDDALAGKSNTGHGHPAGDIAAGTFGAGSFTLIDTASAHMGLVLENADARAGIELETQSATVAGEGILNLGINTDRHITSKGTSPAGMWFRLDTRSAQLRYVWIYRAAGATAVSELMSLSSAGVLSVSGTAVSLEGHAHSAADITSGTLVVARGGTGLSSLSASQVPYAISTSDFTMTSGGTDGQVLSRVAGSPAWADAPGSNFDDTPPAADRWYRASGTTAGAHEWSTWALPTGEGTDGQFLTGAGVGLTQFRALNASDITAGTFGSGDYTFPAALSVSGASTLTNNIAVGGDAPVSGQVVRVNAPNISGGLHTYGVVSHSTHSSGSTGSGTAYYGQVRTAAAAYTMASAYAFRAINPAIGTGSAITTAYGLYVESLTAGGTNYAIYTAGSTQSYFGGAVEIGGALTLSTALPVASGGTGLGATYAAGDIIYALGASDLTTLGVGTSPDGHVLTLVGGTPAWAAPGGTSGFSGTRTWVSGSDEHTVQVTDGVIDSWTVGPAPA